MTNCSRYRRVWHWGLVLLCFDFGVRCLAAASVENGGKIAVNRGLGFIQKEALAWKDTRKCAACHHAAMVTWTFNEAKAAGYSVDTKVLKEVSEWSFGDMKTNSLTAQEPPRNVVNLGWVYVLLAMETAPQFGVNASAPPASVTSSTRAGAATPDDVIGPARRTLIDQIIAKQVEDGSWGKPLDERVPLGGPIEDITVLCRLALLQTRDPSPPIATCREKAATWLLNNSEKTSRQGRNFRLLMNLCEGQSLKELGPRIEAIAGEQNADGGWSQTPELASDAYATGQTLYVLVRAGIKPESTVIIRGVDFLIRTQGQEGSWPMVSRVHAKNLRPITTTGTAWALLGLIRSSR